jgi:hypothetical protein
MVHEKEHGEKSRWTPVHVTCDHTQIGYATAVAP